jgi:hypothetical protein
VDYWRRTRDAEQLPLRASCEGGGGEMMRDSLGRSVVVRGEARRGVEIMQEAWGRSCMFAWGEQVVRDVEIMQVVAWTKAGYGRHGDHAGGLEEIRLVRDIGDHASGLDESRFWATWRSCKRLGENQVRETHWRSCK